ncbi:MAG: serine/threonine-protein kinase [Polyangiaceae bacterium]
MKSPAILQPGALLLGRYEVRRLLGEGGMGAVYLAWHRTLEMPVAIKVLREPLEMESHEQSLRRFAREARSLARVRSEYVCRPYDFGTLETGEPYLVLEYLDGPSLADFVTVNRVTLTSVMDVVAQAAAGLAEAHRVGLVHRDVKPTNIILAPAQGRRSVAKLVDFGLSKSIGLDSLVTNSGRIVGTPEFMSPEQIRGGLVGHRTDVWALGVLLFWLLSARYPFQAQTRMRLLGSILDDPPIDLRTFRPDLSPKISEILSAALEKDPVSRTPTVAALAAELAPFVSPAGALAIDLAVDTLRVDTHTIDMPNPFVAASTSARQGLNESAAERAARTLRDAMGGAAPAPAVAPVVPVEVPSTIIDAPRASRAATVEFSTPKRKPSP